MTPKRSEAVAADPKVAKADFPKATLEDALRLPNALLLNGGQPLPAIDMATALGISPGSSLLRTLNAAASAYGLSRGTYKTNFSMAPTGQAIVEPTSPEEHASALVAAALTPRAFRGVFDYYKGKKVPDRTFFVNTVVREFGVDPKQAEAFVDILTANLHFVGLIKDTPGGLWIAAEATPQSTSVTLSPSEVSGLEAEIDEPGGVNIATPNSEPPTAPEPTPVRKTRPNRIFVGHGRNHEPLDQLTKTLTNLGIPYLVAEHEPNAGRPISAKVRETMEQCGAAILIFSADVEYFDAAGDSVWRPSENVSHELGAASIMYNDRIIMFKEEDVHLASNFSGIGYISFAKDALDAKVNDLLKELIAFKILKLAVNDE